MGLASGTFAIRRYRHGKLEKKLSTKKFEELVEPYKIGPLELNRHEEQIVGWVRPQLYPEDDALAVWGAADATYRDGYALRMRIEKRKVAGPLVAELYRQRFHELLQSASKPPTKKQKADLREKVRQDLRKAALPQISYLDAVWSVSRSEVWCLSAAKAANQAFLDLFRNTFGEALGIHLIPVEPALLGLSDEQWNNPDLAGPTLDQLSLTAPALFEGEGAGVVTKRRSQSAEAGAQHH